MARQPTKCCCCLPLRPGLLAWAYIKLVIAFASIGAYFYFMGPRLRYLLSNVSRHNMPISFIFEELLPVFVVCLPYLVFTIILIIGLHRQNSKMLLVFLVYSIFEVILAGGAVGWQVYDLVQDLSYYNADNSETIARNIMYYRIHSPLVYSRLIILVVVNILLPIYFIVLIKSEVQRLKTRVAVDGPVTDKQGRRYYFDDETPDPRKPLFPVEELKRLRQQLGVKNV